jgi:hypothetical protein
MKPETGIKIVALPIELHRDSFAVTRAVVSPASDPITIWLLANTPVAFKHKDHIYIGTVLETQRADLKKLLGFDFTAQLIEQGAHSWRSLNAFHEQLEELLEQKIGVGNSMELYDANDPSYRMTFPDSPTFAVPFDPDLPVS